MTEAVDYPSAGNMQLPCPDNQWIQKFLLKARVGVRWWGFRATVPTKIIIQTPREQQLEKQCELQVSGEWEYAGEDM